MQPMNIVHSKYVKLFNKNITQTTLLDRVQESTIGSRFSKKLDVTELEIIKK